MKYFGNFCLQVKQGVLHLQDPFETPVQTTSLVEDLQQTIYTVIYSQLMNKFNNSNSLHIFIFGHVNKYQFHNVINHLSTFFSWNCTVAQYGLVLLQPILHTLNPTKNQTQMLYLRRTMRFTDGKLPTTSCHYIVAFSISQHSLQSELRFGVHFRLKYQLMNLNRSTLSK